jgi:very-short-patch-repair endonuclease
MHFKRLLTERTVAEDGDTDPNSPMEKKLLSWLKATPFFQQESERIELMAQFPIGEYLRQLDPTYRHPAYKTDFLLRHLGEQITNVVIEYDGFEHHFVSKEKVSAATFERYYKPEDVERQFVLESYGYRFLRVNRFNLGQDPVATLDARLREIVELSGERSDEGSTVTKIKAQAQALEDKEAKLCSKCKEVKDLEGFYDQSLGSGKGGYGRVCMSCKQVVKAVRTPADSSASYRRRWRRY